jgi:heme exporter protein D
MADFWVWFAYAATYGFIIGYALYLRMRRRRLDEVE